MIPHMHAQPQSQQSVVVLDVFPFWSQLNQATGSMAESLEQYTVTRQEFGNDDESAESEDDGPRFPGVIPTIPAAAPNPNAPNEIVLTHHIPSLRSRSAYEVFTTGKAETVPYFVYEYVMAVGNALSVDKWGALDSYDIFWLYPHLWVGEFHDDISLDVFISRLATAGGCDILLKILVNIKFVRESRLDMACYERIFSTVVSKMIDIQSCIDLLRYIPTAWNEYGSMEFWTTVYKGCISSARDIDVARFLMDFVSTDSDIVLIGAIKRGDLSVLKYFINLKYKNDSSRLIAYRDTTNNGWTLLHYAANAGYVYIVDYLCKYGVDPNVRNSLGKSALHYAVDNGYTESVKYLIPLTKNLADEFDNTILHYAISTQKVESVKTVLECSASSSVVNINAVNFMGCCPLHTAVATGDINMVQLVLDQCVKNSDHSCLMIEDLATRMPVQDASFRGLVDIATLLIHFMIKHGIADVSKLHEIVNEDNMPSNAENFHKIKQLLISLQDNNEENGNNVVISPPSFTL